MLDKEKEIRTKTHRLGAGTKSDKDRQGGQRKWWGTGSDTGYKT